MQHTGRLTGLSGQLGQRARTNSEQLLAVNRTHEEWERDPERDREQDCGCDCGCGAGTAPMRDKR